MEKEKKNIINEDNTISTPLPPSVSFKHHKKRGRSSSDTLEYIPISSSSSPAVKQIQNINGNVEIINTIDTSNSIKTKNLSNTINNNGGKRVKLNTTTSLSPIQPPYASKKINIVKIDLCKDKINPHVVIINNNNNNSNDINNTNLHFSDLPHSSHPREEIISSYNVIPESVKTARFIDLYLAKQSSSKNDIKPLSTDPTFIEDPLVKLTRIGTPKNGNCYFSALSFYLYNNFKHAKHLRFLTYDYASRKCFGLGIADLKLCKNNQCLSKFRECLPNYEEVKKKPDIIDHHFPYALVMIWKCELDIKLMYYSDRFIIEFREYLLNQSKNGVWAYSLSTSFISADLHRTAILLHHVNKIDWFIERLMIFKGEYIADEIQHFCYLIFYDKHFDLLLLKRPKKIIIPCISPVIKKRKGKQNISDDDDNGDNNDGISKHDKIINRIKSTRKQNLYDDNITIPLFTDSQLPSSNNHLNNINILNTVISHSNNSKININNTNSSTTTSIIPLTLKLAMCNPGDEEDEEMYDVGNNMTNTSSSSLSSKKNSNNSLLSSTNNPQYIFTSPQKSLQLYYSDLVDVNRSLVCGIPLIKHKEERIKIFRYILSSTIKKARLITSSSINIDIFIDHMDKQTSFCYKYNAGDIVNIKKNHWIFHACVPEQYHVFALSILKLDKTQPKIIMKGYREEGSNEPLHFMFYNDDDNNNKSNETSYYGNHIIYILCVETPSATITAAVQQTLSTNTKVNKNDKSTTKKTKYVNITNHLLSYSEFK